MEGHFTLRFIQNKMHENDAHKVFEQKHHKCCKFDKANLLSFHFSRKCYTLIFFGTKFFDSIFVL